MSKVAARLKAMGLELPPQHPPTGNYVGFVTSGNLVHVAGVGPTWGSAVRYSGKVGGSLSFEDGYAAARLTALNLLAHMQAACGGDLDRIARCVKVFALVNAGPDYTDAHKVADGATDLIAAVFGPENLPARAVTTTLALPFDIAFEADAVFLLH
ncbi:MAG: RidA family protein [Ferrovibrio sp.]|uniref:RidA family protein n=1 Tax=Ferrovibrio sp. TaxID=1917215 RepID=UPI00391DF38C